MQQQSNALRRLEEVLSQAVKEGDGEDKSASVLLNVMGIEDSPKNICDFYALLNKAREQAKSIRKKSESTLQRYIETIEQTNHQFAVRHLHNEPWKTLARYIKTTNVLNTLDALADFYHSENPSIALEQDFLNKLNNEFSDILDSILSSNLSNELKAFLRKQIEDIQTAIRRYYLDGTEGIEKAAKSFVSDLIMKEYTFNDDDKKNPIYNRLKSLVVVTLIYITPSPYDIAGVVPAIDSYWIPRFEELIDCCQNTKQRRDETLTIQEVIEKSSSTRHKFISGKTTKALPASEDKETNIENQN